MKKKIIPVLTVSALCLLSNGILAWEPYDRVIAVVNNACIIESDINTKYNQVIKFKKTQAAKPNVEKSRVLDKFIEDALVNETAADEAIIVSSSKIIAHIERLLRHYYEVKNINVDDKKISALMARLEKRLAKSDIMPDKKLDPEIDQFFSFVESQQKLNFANFYEEIRNQMIKEQVMSIAVGVTPPSKQQAMEWYKSNKKMFGDEVWVKHILIKLSGNSILAEKDANKKISEIRERAIAGESFEALAKKYSQDKASAAKGGDMGWTMLAELDPYFAGYLNNNRANGQITEVFKSGMGYHIVKYIGRRETKFEKVEPMIMYKLYMENMDLQFKKWIKKRKKESDIKIFMDNYTTV
jgi:putative peptidyl-prolyl cis-trans isomerase